MATTNKGPAGYGAIASIPIGSSCLLQRIRTLQVPCGDSRRFIGGFTAARRAAAVADQFQIRTGWHGSPDQAPVGHMAHLTLDLTSRNFGFHEYFGLSEHLRELFPGAIAVRSGFAWGNDRPGWGIEVNEAAIAKLPPGKEGVFELHSPDGALMLGL